MLTIALLAVALYVAWVIGRRSGYDIGYRSGAIDTAAVYNMLAERARLLKQKKEEEA